MAQSDNVKLSIRPEATPNPRSVRFVLDRALMEGCGADFRSLEKAERSPLARRLFGIDGVAGVFVGPNFVTITTGGQPDWNAVMEQVDRLLREHIASGEPAVVGGGDGAGEGRSEIEKGIIRVIEEEIRPAVAMDGGDVVFGGYEDGVVHLHLRGACAGCPSSVMTLKMGIERRLKEEFPEIVSVEGIF